jgi:hypothetical protein
LLCCSFGLLPLSSGEFTFSTKWRKFPSIHPKEEVNWNEWEVALSERTSSQYLRESPSKSNKLFGLKEDRKEKEKMPHTFPFNKMIKYIDRYGMSKSVIHHFGLKILLFFLFFASFN